MQKTTQRRGLAPVTNRNAPLPPSARGGGGGGGGPPRGKVAPRLPSRRTLGHGDGDGAASSSDEWSRGARRGPRVWTGGAADDEEHEEDDDDSDSPVTMRGDEAHKENLRRVPGPGWPAAKAKARHGGAGGEARLKAERATAYDATDDIHDIDRRLNALQHFLEAAKAPRG